MTGGAGLIGSHVVDLLLADGAAEIVVLDDFSRGTRANLAAALETGKVRVVEGDIGDRETVSRVTAGMDLVFHQAAIRITRCAEEPRTALEVLVDGTFNVVEAAADRGVRGIVAASSASVYGLATSFPTGEAHHPYANRTLYGAAKTFNEGLLRSFHDMRGLDYVALRYFNVYGPRMDVHGVYTEVLIRWIHRIRDDLPPLIFGDGHQTMDFVYIEDVARANLLAARALVGGRVTDRAFNVARGEETSLRTLAERLLAVMGRSDLVPEHVAERAVNPVPRRLADIEQARDALGFVAETPLDEGLRRLVAWVESTIARKAS